MGAPRPLDQRAFFVEKQGTKYLGYWLEYETGSRRRTHIAVMKCTSMLLPRHGVGFAYAVSAYDVSRAEARGWLESAGYRIVAEME